jgi:hypothetical protein
MKATAQSFENFMSLNLHLGNTKIIVYDIFVIFNIFGLNYSLTVTELLNSTAYLDRAASAVVVERVDSRFIGLIVVARCSREINELDESIPRPAPRADPAAVSIPST